jgi:hypothetical protein
MFVVVHAMYTVICVSVFCSCPSRRVAPREKVIPSLVYRCVFVSSQSYGKIAIYLYLA